MAEVTVTNDRGFHGYSSFTDTYGAAVKVYQSSAATQDCVWISVYGGAIKRNNGVAHLNRAQAEELIAALRLWITDIEREA